MPLTTEIVNFTSANVRVQEGNKNVITYRYKEPVEPTKFHKVSVNSNDTFKLFMVGPETWDQHVKISSDDCTDNKIIYVRASNTGPLFTDPVPREAKLVGKNIVNKTAETIVLMEEVTMRNGLVASSEVEKLGDQKTYTWKVDPAAGHRKYLMKLKESKSGFKTVEIPNFKDKQRIEVVLDDFK